MSEDNLQILEEDLCMYCLNHNCWNCKFENACHNFCEKHVFYPAVLTDVYKNGTPYYDGDDPQRVWDNI